MKVLQEIQNPMLSHIYTRDEKGSSLISILMSIAIVAIMGISVSQSSAMAIRMRHKALNDSLALQLAQETIEDFATVDMSTLNDGQVINNSTSKGERTFNIQSTVSVNADNTRTITVSVSLETPTLGGNASLQNTFALDY